MIVHRPKFAKVINPEIATIRQETDPIVDSLSRQILDLLEMNKAKLIKSERQKANVLMR